MLNKLTYNELLCLSCLVTAATTTVHGSAAAAVGAAADTPLSKTERFDFASCHMCVLLLYFVVAIFDSCW